LLKPTDKEVDTYVNWSQVHVFVQTLTSQSPLEKIHQVKMPKLEKIITDLFSNEWFYEP